MLDRKLWTSFEKELTLSDVDKIESRLHFLRDVLEDAAKQYDVEDVRSELDQNLHIYLKYFELAGGTTLTAWLIHDAWLGYYQEGSGLNASLRDLIARVYDASDTDLRGEIAGFLTCLSGEAHIAAEVDAVVWLSFLDYMASRLIYRIAHDRFRALFSRLAKSQDE